MASRTAYYRYWAKSPEGEHDAHLVPYHNLDVAACAKAFLGSDPILQEQLGAALGIEPDSAARLIVYLIALHDAGKFADSFQRQNLDLVRDLNGPCAAASFLPPYPVIQNGKAMYHGAFGALAWDKWIGMQWTEAWGLTEALGEGEARRVMRPLVDAVMGHHGRPVPIPKSDRVERGVFIFGEEAVADATRFADEVAALLRPDELPVWPSDLSERATRISWTVAGLAVIADWIGSDERAFPRTVKPIPLAEYWALAQTRAKEAVESAGVRPPRVAPGGGMVNLFGFDTPTPLQRYAETVCFGEREGPHLFVLEDLTGSGKTEAAIVLAHRLIQVGLGSGLYVGLPTMATANQMFERLERAVGKLFEDPKEASVVLAHSARDLSARYREIVLSKSSEVDSGNGSDDDASAAAQCADWIASSRKRALLAALGVGTIDQALLGVLPAAHQSLRLLGVGRHVLVLDEVHAYDRYMLALIERLLTFQAAAGGSTILLSATLPHDTRQRFADAFHAGLGAASVSLARTGNDDYPLATHVYARSLHETPIERRPGARRTLRVRRYASEAKVVEALVNAASEGRCAVWVRNTVHDALNGFRLVRNAARKKSTARRVDLLHARFALGHRLEKEVEILGALGPEGSATERRGRIVVATQVIEQSLDLDADVLISDLAPIDLLIQRAGRLHRHVRDAQGNRVTGPAGRDIRNDERGEAVLGVLAPSETDTPDAAWFARAFPRAAYVYPDHGRLWLTAREVPHDRVLTFPDDARHLIRAIYGPGSDAAIPDALAARTNKAEAEETVNEETAKTNALRYDRGYGGNDGLIWERDDAKRTRLGERTITLRLVEMDADGEAKALVKDEKRPWEMSEVRVRRSMFGEAIVEPGDREALGRATREMSDRGRHVTLVPLRLSESREVWYGQAKDPDGKTLIVRYSIAEGLEFLPSH